MKKIKPHCRLADLFLSKIKFAYENYKNHIKSNICSYIIKDLVAILSLKLI